jgi:hypothetical protein
VVCSNFLSVVVTDPLFRLPLNILLLLAAVAVVVLLRKAVKELDVAAAVLGAIGLLRDFLFLKAQRTPSP